MKIPKDVVSLDTTIRTTGNHRRLQFDVQDVANISNWRAENVFTGMNRLHFSSEHVNYVTLQIIPPKRAEADKIELG